MAETADLKSLARLVLERDAVRDSRRDGSTRDCLAADASPRRHFERVSLSRFHKGPDAEIVIPTDYACDYEVLERCCPSHVDLADWQQAVADGRHFLAHWGEKAAALGWSARDLFALAAVPERPAANYRRLSRYDHTGLIWLLQGQRVVALTEDTAVIENSAGTVSYRRNNKPALGPVGDSSDDMEGC